MNAEEIVHAQQMVKEVLIADDMLEYAVDIIAATHPECRSHTRNWTICAIWKWASWTSKFDQACESTGTCIWSLSCVDCGY